MPDNAKTMTVGELKKELEGVSDDVEIFFGSGDLSFFRTKWRGDNLLQIEFNEVYEITLSP